MTFTGVVVLPGDAAGDAEGEATGLATGEAVATGVAVAAGLPLFVTPLFAGELLHAPRTATAARTELITNDLLIFLLMPSLG